MNTKFDEVDERAAVVEASKLMDEAARLKTEIEKRDAAIADMNARHRAAELKGAMLKALEKAGCTSTKAELAFRAFGDSLKLVDGGRVVGTGKVDGLTLELGLDEFISKIVKRDVGEFFARPGAPASASSGGGAGKDFDFTEEQVADTQFYLEHRDAIAEAYGKGRVRTKQRQR